MRILGEFDRKGIKCTVMSMSGKISLKLEKNLLEQIYKFRDGSGINNYDDAMNLASDVFIARAEEIFETMASIRISEIEKLHPNNSAEEFDYIV